MKLTLMHYTPTDLQEKELASADEVQPFLAQEGVTWLHVQGLDDPEGLERLGEVFKLHPLAMEDITKDPQRPKAEEYENHEFLICHLLEKHRAPHVTGLKVCLCMGGNYLLTFIKAERDYLEPVRARVRKAQGVIRQRGVDHLLYAVLDEVIDSYFPALEDLGDYLERVQEETLSSANLQQTLRSIQLAKHVLLRLRRLVWPMRDLLNMLMRSDNDRLTEAVRQYLRDCYDHVAQLVDMVETYREMTTDVMDAYLSALSNRMNAVMKVLTIIATIFMPLSFICGVYGMNFGDGPPPFNMPELKLQYGYPLVWLLMIGITVWMLMFFKRKGWIGQPDLPSDEPLRLSHKDK